MKKYALLFLIILCTGCSNVQTLTCTKSNNDNGFAMDEKFVFNFESKKVNFLDLNLSFSLDDNYLEYVDIVNNNIEKILNTYQNEEGITVSTLEELNNIVVNVKVDYTKVATEINSDTLDIYKYKENVLTIDELKTNMEANLYSCVISDK